jgi:hypothetical protein
MMILPCESDGTISGSASPQVLYAGGITDAQRVFAFFANANSTEGIEAIDLHSGRSFWNAPGTNYPLVAIGNCVIAESWDFSQTNRLTVQVLDVSQNGKSLRASTPLSFPNWVDVTVRGDKFSTRGEINRDKLILRWEAHQNGQDAYGIYQLDFRTGAWSSIANSLTPLPPESLLPPSLETLTSLPYWVGNVSSTKPMVVYTSIFTLGLEPAGALNKLNLMAWDSSSGAPGDTTSLLTGQSFEVRRSEDGQYLFVREGAASSYSVFGMPSGNLLTTQPYDADYRDVSVSGYSVIFLKAGAGQKTLDSRDFWSGDLQWSYSLPSF